MTYFHQHQKEFYFHLGLLLVIGGSLFSFFFFTCDPFLYWLTYPLLQLLDAPLFIVTDIIELFSIKLYVASVLSGLISLGLFLGQCWWFLAPGLYKKDNQLVFFFIITFSLTFLGFSYGIYTFLLPQMWSFFLSYHTMRDPTILMITFEPHLFDYLTLLFQTVFYMLLLLQYPLILIILLRMKIFHLGQFIQYRKVLYLQLFILSSFIAPPDLISQSILCIGLVGSLESVFFYECFIKQSV